MTTLFITPTVHLHPMSTQAPNEPTQGCQGPGYYLDAKTGEVHWHGPAAIEVAYWRRRALAAESQIDDFENWKRMRDENVKRKFWHTQEKGKTR